MFAILFCLLGFDSSGDISGELELARARIRMAGVIAPKVSTSIPKIQPTEPVTPPVPEVARTVLTLYTTNPCPPCIHQKMVLGLHSDYPQIKNPTPFDFKVVDETKEQVPVWCTEFPCLAWSVPGGGVRYHFGYVEPNQLEALWKANQQPVVVSPVRQANNYNPRWFIRSGESLPDHLKNTHGVNISGMTQDQMEMTHDQIHENESRGRRR